MASQLMINCSCPVPSKYIAQTSMTCDDGATDRVVVQGDLIGTDDSSGAELHSQLESWLNTTQEFLILGVPLEVVSCSTYPGFELTCRETSSTTPVTMEAEDLFLSGTTLYAVIAAGVVAIFIVIAAIVVVVIVVLKKRRHGSKTTDMR